MSISINGKRVRRAVLNRANELTAIDFDDGTRLSLEIAEGGLDALGDRERSSLVATLLPAPPPCPHCLLPQTYSRYDKIECRVCLANSAPSIGKRRRCDNCSGFTDEPSEICATSAVCAHCLRRSSDQWLYPDEDESEQYCSPECYEANK